MKGLLIKDFHLMKMQKRFFIVLVAMAVIMAATSNDASFVMGYLAIVIPMFSLSTISYDEFDNGNVFLFTLPITRKGYVLEKYCFSILLGLGSLLLGMVLSLCMGAWQKNLSVSQTLMAAVPLFGIMLMTLSIMMPLQLKLGAEKGRIAMLAIFGGIFAIGYGVFRWIPSVDTRLVALVTKLNQMNTALLVMAAASFVLAVVGISAVISIRIMNKKEL